MLSRLPLALALIAVVLAGCGSREVQPARTGSGVERVSPVRAAEINTRLGIGYLERGEIQIALEKLEKAIEQDPSHVPALLGLGIVYETIGQPEQALVHLQRAVRLAPEDGAAHNSYGALLCRVGRFDQADRHFQRALEDPFYRTPSAALANAGSCARRGGDPESAEAYLREALQIDPNNQIALFQMADLSYARNDPFRARAFLQRLESVSEPDPATLMLGYRIEASLGSGSDARRYAELLFSQFPNSQQAHQLRQEHRDDE